MHATLRSARLAPKKANLMAMMIRGRSVPDAVELLRRTHKKSARLLEGVLLSAMANAGHNFRQDPQTMVIREVVVNQGSSLRRGVPMARGRVRPIRKFLCHISVTLGYAGQETINTSATAVPAKAPKAAKQAAPVAPAAVKKASTPRRKKVSPSDSSN